MNKPILAAITGVSFGLFMGGLLFSQSTYRGCPRQATRTVETTSIALGSLYIPETMPYGAFEFTPEVRADPRYQSIWRADPRLAELVKMRLASLEAGEMAGVLPNIGHFGAAGGRADYPTDLGFLA